MLVDTVYLKDHASNKEGDKKRMPESTAKALAAHGVLKVVEKSKGKE